MTSWLLAAFLLVLPVFAPGACAQGAADDKGTSQITPETEAHYQMCLTEARQLQRRFAACTTDACRDEVKKDFDTWTSKCFKS